MTADSGIRKKKKHHKSKRPSEPTVPEGDEETVDESIENGDDRESEYSASTNGDVEDPKRALVNAFAQSIRDMGEEGAENDADVLEAQTRINNMLNDMLAFSPPPKSLKPSTSLSIDSSGDDSEEGREQEKEDEGESGNANAGSPRMKADGNLSDVDESEQDAERAPTEETGLLTGEPLSSVTANLKPSIFTSIASSITSSENAGNKEEYDAR